MYRTMMACLLSLVLAAPALAWNNKGHMVVAQLAYDSMSSAQRDAIQDILKKHPHYDEFLAADRPENVPEAQWVFWRAATWPDWVRNHHTADYSHPTWHYVDYPFIPKGSKLNPADHQPSDDNAVTKLQFCIDKVKSGTAEEKPIYLCWVFHLIGDIHQPLHCVSLFSENFPKGDHGGNWAQYQLAGGRVITLHPFWDKLLGTSTSLKSVVGTEKKVQKIDGQALAKAKHDLETNKTIESWAKETFALAVEYAYLNGDPEPANVKDDSSEGDIPEVPDEYTTDAGEVARLAMLKAGHRLADTLKEIVPSGGGE